jgi:hypothetical protein
MSKYLESIQEDFGNVEAVLQYYRKELSDIDSHIRLKGKQIDAACIEQAGWHSYYDSKRVELKAIHDYIEIKLASVHSLLWKKLTEKHSRDLTQKDKEIYIKQNTDFIDMEILLVHTKEVLDLYISAVDSFKYRGYALNNLTRLRIAEHEDWVI